MLFLLRPSILLSFSLHHVSHCQLFNFSFSYTFQSPKFTRISQHVDKYLVSIVVSAFICCCVVICSALQEPRAVQVYSDWCENLELLEVFDLDKAFCESFPTVPACLKTCVCGANF